MQVLFSDEKCSYGKGFCGRTYVARPNGEALNEEFICNKIAHPVKVNAWVCFCSSGGTIHVFHENLDAIDLVNIFEDHLIETVDLNFVDDHAGQWWLLHDNDSKFTSKRVQDWLFNNGINILDFPAQSPDLNPTENLWNELARRVEKHQAETVEELENCICEEWYGIEVQYLTTLAHSMTRRCEAIIAAVGTATKY